MKCNELKQHLEQSVEGRNPLSLNDWRDHLEQCDDCRKACEDHQLLDHAVEEWVNFDETPDLTDQIMAALEGDEIPRPALPGQRFTGSRFIPILATAVVVLFLFFNLRTVQQVDPPTSFVNGPPVSQSELESAENVNLDRVLLETRNAYGSLLGQAQSTIGPLKTVLTDSEQESPPLVGESPRTAITQIVPAELDPLKAELAQSFGFLSSLLPEKNSR